MFSLPSICFVFNLRRNSRDSDTYCFIKPENVRANNVNHNKLNPVFAISSVGVAVSIAFQACNWSYQK